MINLHPLIGSFKRLSPFLSPSASFFFLYIIASVAGWASGSPSGFSTDPLWLRWDSFHYLSIAKEGYQGEVCGAFVCGNTGWFPLYPLLIRLVSFISLSSLENASILVVFISFLILCSVLSSLTGNRWSPLGVSVALVVLPGGIYLVSGFPVTIMLLFCMICLFSLKRKMFGIACFTAFLAGTSYPSSILFCLCLLPFLLVRNPLLGLRNSWKRIVVFASFPVSFVLSSLLIQNTVNIYNAYALTQSRDGHTMSLGFEALRSSVRYFYKNPIFFQTFTVCILLVLCAWLIASRPIVRDRFSLGLLAYGFAVFLLTSLTGDTLSSYRQEALMTPLFVYVGSYLPRSALICISVPLALGSLMMARLFFDGTLV